ncbi:Hypothetical_protein [Hexamita inflata]|uniref:Hypothetical_protein n=1 Tax=Hexamita inflata TaxID=28002 RepID=A0AA86UK34_9EUKA|nr:Hypothetical protein HINF_LOCUS33953 [Hexamita inflata]CAI9954446.1 Hypothetical protein HINF_LOCUS42091 [Hexamita inflata]
MSFAQTLGNHEQLFTRLSQTNQNLNNFIQYQHELFNSFKAFSNQLKTINQKYQKICTAEPECVNFPVILSEINLLAESFDVTYQQPTVQSFNKLQSTLQTSYKVLQVQQSELNSLKQQSTQLIQQHADLKIKAKSEQDLNSPIFCQLDKTLSKLWKVEAQKQEKLNETIKNEQFIDQEGRNILDQIENSWEEQIQMLILEQLKTLKSIKNIRTENEIDVQYIDWNLIKEQIGQKLKGPNTIAITQQESVEIQV